MMHYYIYLLFGVSFLSLLLIIDSAYKEKKFRLSFVVLLLCILIWTTGYALELLSHSINEKLFWAKFEYFGIANIGVVWFILVLQYAGKRNALTARNVTLLFLDPLLTIILVWTNKWHHLIWNSISVKSFGNLSILVFKYGAWAKIHTAYVYFLLSISIFILFQITSHSYKYYKKQSLALLLSSFIPWLSHIGYAFRFFYIDPTPFAFLVTATIFAYIFKSHLLDIAPVAKEKVIENMRNILIVLDKNLKIIYLNNAAIKLIGVPQNNLIGKSVETLSMIHPDLPRLYSNAMKEITIKNRHFELQSSSITNECGEESGYFIILNDITERKMAEKEMEQALKLEREIKNRIAHYFLNPIAIAKGFLMLSIEERKNDEIKKALNAIERIEKIVENIIRKGRIEE
ncbi:MAG: PAS domain S-box protein [Thermoplasmata archaeon]|nr:PAS domain S-box protein [Thermoplasmata archaeon]